MDLLWWQYLNTVIIIIIIIIIIITTTTTTTTTITIKEENYNLWNVQNDSGMAGGRRDSTTDGHQQTSLENRLSDRTTLALTHSAQHMSVHDY